MRDADLRRHREAALQEQAANSTAEVGVAHQRIVASRSCSLFASRGLHSASLFFWLHAGQFPHEPPLLFLGLHFPIQPGHS